MVDVRTNWQNAQMTLVAHKRSSTSDTRQNQLAECPNSTSTHKQPSTEPIGRHSQMGRLPACTPVDLSSLGARQLIPNASFHSTRKSGKLAASAEQGRSRGGSSKQTVLAAARNVPQSPAQGWLATSSRLRLSEPSRPLEDPGEPATASSSQPHVWHQNLLRKGMWGSEGCPATRCSKASKQARLVERKVCFISDASNCEEWGCGADICLKSDSPCDKQGVRAFIDRSRGDCMLKQLSHP